MMIAVTDDLAAELAAARQAGREAAEAALSEAPMAPLAKVAWLKGSRQVDNLPAAVAEARQAGATWPEIAVALDEHPRTVANKFGGAGSADRQRAYRQRKQQK